MKTKTAAKSKQPQAIATAENPPTQNKPAPPGSKPAAAAVEKIRELRGKIAGCDRDIESLQRAFVVATGSFRADVVSRLSLGTSDDTPVEKLWDQYEARVRDVGEVGYVYTDLQQSLARYVAAKEPYLERVQERNALREQLQAVLKAEAPKLTVALREGGEDFRARAVAAVAPFVSDQREAEELAGEMSKIQNFILARFRWTSGGGATPEEAASAFLNAWEEHNAALAAAADLHL